MDQPQRQIFASEGLAHIPKILTLQDRNQHSPTYGCFDRNYWHYRIIDFPSGMAQEFVLPLALAFSLDIPGNPYFAQSALRDWVLAGIRFAAKSAHSDGSCDDYFPYERAGGAAAFSLLASLEAYRILELDDEACREFFAKRADWLANHHESGRLSNHQALIALCLELAGQILDTDRWAAKAEERIDLVLSWQTAEGWFWEYEGCDPGYLTLTISVLAWLHSMRPKAPYAERLKETLIRATEFVGHFIHPDGSFGGEYGSRNTYSYFPLGFELVGRWHPPALRINDEYLKGLAKGRGPCFSDDHILGHHAWNYLLAWRDFKPERPAARSQPEGRSWFPEAKLLVERRSNVTLFAALNKGGVFKIFEGDRLAASDTQFSVLTSDTPSRNAVGHLIDDYKIEFGDNEIGVAGSLGWAKQKRMTTFNLVALRLIMLTGGRLFPNLIRRMLQKMLITGKTTAPFRFDRCFRWENEGLKVEDRLEAENWNGVSAVGLGCDQTSIYVVMSRTFQAAQLGGWQDLTEEAQKLGKNEALALSRRFES
jgi:hypothetical protein